MPTYRDGADAPSEFHHCPHNPTVHDNAALHRWVEANGGTTVVGVGSPRPYISLDTAGGQARVRAGDTIARTATGEFYLMREVEG